MDEKMKEIFYEIKKIVSDNYDDECINKEIFAITSKIDNHQLEIESRVRISQYVLSLLTKEQRIALCKDIIREQIVEQREKLSHWSTITAQSEMIDTGYISQHLVSLCTQISGQGMRGKGLDLVDGSEVKSANFIDSKDKNGATSPRWNFSSPSDDKLLDFLHYKYIYLVSLDYSVNQNYRIRIWKIDVRTHTALRKRYKEWLDLPGRNSRNFQLFPPKSESDSIYAHHGSNKPGQLPPTEIALENVTGASKIFHAEVEDDGVKIMKSPD